MFLFPKSDSCMVFSLRLKIRPLIFKSITSVDIVTFDFCRRKKLNSYDKIFGSGPSGVLITTALLVLVYYLEDIVSLPRIVSNDVVGFSFLLNNWILLNMGISFIPCMVHKC